MATVDQAAFIKDLVLQKQRDFSTFKKWLATTGIVRTNGQIFSKSMNLKEIINRVTVAQASQIIEAMQLLPDVKYESVYSSDQVAEVNGIISEIEREVESWTFIQQ